MTNITIDPNHPGVSVHVDPSSEALEVERLANEVLPAPMTVPRAIRYRMVAEQLLQELNALRAQRSLQSR